MPKTALSYDLIVGTAMALVEREGADALTMRGLGGELGVEAMSLYHHVASREALVEAVGARLLAPLVDLRFDDDWRAACRVFAETLREIAVASPATFRLHGLQPLETPEALRTVERLLATLVAGGFSAPDALAVYRGVASFARGYALAEVTGFTVDAASPSARARLQALRAEDFPILAGHAAELAQLDAQAAFDRGLAALLDGFGDPR